MSQRRERARDGGEGVGESACEKQSNVSVGCLNWKQVFGRSTAPDVWRCRSNETLSTWRVSETSEREAGTEKQNRKGKTQRRESYVCILKNPTLKLFHLYISNELKKKKYEVMKLLFPVLLLFVPHRIVFLWFCFHCSAKKFPFNQLPGVDG